MYNLMKFNIPNNLISKLGTKTKRRKILVSIMTYIYNNNNNKTKLMLVIRFTIQFKNLKKILKTTPVDPTTTVPIYQKISQLVRIFQN